MVGLLHSTPTYTIPGQKLIPLCCRGHLPSSHLPPLICAIGLSSLFITRIELEREKNLQAPQVLLSAHTMKSPLLPVLKVELARFWEALAPCPRSVKID